MEIVTSPTGPPFGHYPRLHMVCPRWGHYYCVRKYNKAVSSHPYCVSQRAYCVSQRAYCVSQRAYCVGAYT